MNELEELRETRVSFKDLFEFVPDALVVVTREGSIVQINKQAEIMFGYSKNELPGTAVEVLIPERFRELYIEHLSKNMSSSRPLESGLELYGRKKDGTEFPAAVSIGQLQTEKGMVAVSLFRDITEHKHIEETLRESEIRFRSVVQSAIDAIILADSDGNIISWNKGARIVFGYEEEEVLDKPLTILMPERYRDAHIKGLERVRTTGKSSYIGKISEMHGLRKDGNEFPLELSRAAWKAGDKTFYGGIIRDITERRQSEEALRASEMKYRGIFENAVVGIFQISLEGRLLAANPSITKMLGYGSPEELIAEITDFRKFFVEPGSRLQLLRTIRTGGILTDFEAQIGRRDGSKFWVLMNATSLRDSGGKVTGLQGMWMDITDSKRAERNFQGLIESLPDAIVAVDKDFNILLVNAQTEKIFGYTRKELLGKPYDLLIPERFREAHARYCADYFSQPSIKTMSLHRSAMAKHKDGSEFQVEINMSPFETEEGIIVVTDIHEITRK
ncbi:MAG TPA: PAS domain S-box protein [Candidatus Methanoperedens sp.]|nr:PAS domain S-box protein [Candidatus Methanoperedens sp.]